jgi:hypothetical protein
VPDGVIVGESRSVALMALGGCAVVLIVLGLMLPSALTTLLNQSVAGLAR